jgi:hypothetical protein
MLIWIAGVSFWLGGFAVGFLVGIRFAKWGDFRFWLIG